MYHLSAVCLLCVCLLVAVLPCTCSPNHDDNEGQGHHREKRSAPTLSNRTLCNPGQQWPSTRVNTTARLAALRAVMTNRSLHAFIVFSADAHESEYPAARDKRRGFITGFSGSAGYAAVTMTRAAMWSDGRYFLEAEDALDCNWIFMKMGEPGVPSMSQWLGSELTSGQVVGADPFLVSSNRWASMAKNLAKSGLTFEAVSSSPVDQVWPDQPPPPKTPINALDVQYAGRRWQDKVLDVHFAMEQEGVHGAYVVTSLDEVAWLFNLRANDIAYNPFFISYAIVEYYGANSSDNKVRLYIQDRDNRLTRDPTDPETPHRLHQHLNTAPNGSCHGAMGMCVQVHDYVNSQVVADIESLESASAANKIWVTPYCNYAIFRAIPEAQLFQARSFIAFAKAQKNPVERRGMEICYKRDSAVLVEFFAKLEKEMSEGKRWTEVSVDEELMRMRRAADKNRGLSFETIAGSGPNGAVIHYRPLPASDRQLTTGDMLLLDSGGQYLDCTTDTTRTVHFGSPTAYMKESYTLVLMGTIDLARAVWPKGEYGRTLEILARHPLYEAGLDYNHATGHGIGAYFSVHEGPGNIGRWKGPFYAHEELLPGMFFSDEPGFYEDGQFGVRLETVVMVEPAHTKYNFRGVQFLHFKPIALVPFETKLINYSMMSNHQISWLNVYHQLCQDHIEPLLTSDLARQWLRERTKPFITPTPTPCNHPPSNPAPKPLPSLLSLLMMLAAAFVCVF
ncbi:hypothetical protein ACOMHN_008960 [Nucella lapillus]